MGLFDRLSGGDDKPRVAFVGIDGVPYTLLQNHPDRFPNFAVLNREGSSGDIDSIVPPESSACWPALTTGVNPGETEVYGFQDRETNHTTPTSRWANTSKPRVCGTALPTPEEKPP